MSCRALTLAMQERTDSDCLLVGLMLIRLLIHRLLVGVIRLLLDRGGVLWRWDMLLLLWRNMMGELGVSATRRRRSVLRRASEAFDLTFHDVARASCVWHPENVWVGDFVQFKKEEMGF